ncbi:MAG: hypothetical protein HY645_08380 [Acidobacteria bacterium]|nr:hypothetical protein [Acidobacteriota bacterium]
MLKQSIGIDFDNTIISYDEVMFRVASEWGLINGSTISSPTKKWIRDRIRQNPEGELQWQKLQGFVYGRGIAEARLTEGVKPFLHTCHAHGLKVCIVSHKTEKGNFDDSGTNLRLAALGWMRNQRFFDPEGLGVSEEDVYFEGTRLAKIERIKSLGCAYFIDDLEETFAEESFPAEVKCILYTPHQSVKSSDSGLFVASNWKEISNYIFRSQERR